jgi:hypothetical protein
MAAVLWSAAGLAGMAHGGIFVIMLHSITSVLTGGTATVSMGEGRRQYSGLVPAASGVRDVGPLLQIVDGRKVGGLVSRRTIGVAGYCCAWVSVQFQGALQDARRRSAHITGLQHLRCRVAWDGLCIDRCVQVPCTMSPGTCRLHTPACVRGFLGFGRL